MPQIDSPVDLKEYIKSLLVDTPNANELVPNPPAGSQYRSLLESKSFLAHLLGHSHEEDPAVAKAKQEFEKQITEEDTKLIEHQK